ncbi:MAG: DNA methylase, partial [Firmicutes bacterium]|nr:DNA methylase [Bacillota bacterium]
KSYRENLWTHIPLTDFWRVGRGYERKLKANGLNAMGDIARCSIGKPNEHYNEELLYKLFGVNAELLIDHAWGYESCTIADIKAYRAERNSFSNGQVLTAPYEFDKARIVAREMALSMSYQLREKHLATDKLTLAIGYDVENLNDPLRMQACKNAVETDFYGRTVPKSTHGSIRMDSPTALSEEIANALVRLFDRLVNRALLIRRLYIGAENVTEESRPGSEQMSLFDLLPEAEDRPNIEKEKENKRMQAVMNIRRRFGKNAIMMGVSLEEGATAAQRNAQVGGHRA